MTAGQAIRRWSNYFPAKLLFGGISKQYHLQSEKEWQLRAGTFRLSKVHTNYDIASKSRCAGHAYGCPSTFDPSPSTALECASKASCMSTQQKCIWVQDGYLFGAFFLPGRLPSAWMVLLPEVCRGTNLVNISLVNISTTRRQLTNN
eukprot:1154472-Pelagomonas_calceolata.AAC.13